MSELEVAQQPLPDPSSLYRGKQEIRDIRELKVGEGSTIFFTDREGSRWGNIVFDDAPAYIKVDGSFKFKNANGDVIIDSLGGGTGDYIQVINSALDSASKTILSDWTFESTDYAGAFKSGNVTWSTVTGLVTGGTGIVINDRGIIGAASGVATFTIDATTGNATFAGTLVAASGTLGSITIGTNAWHVDSSGNMWWGNYSNYSDAIIKISSSGSIDFSTGNIVGATIKATSSASGANVFLDPTNKRISFLYNDVEKGLIYCDSSGNVVIDADDGLFLTANGTGDDIFLTAGDDIFSDCNEWIVLSSGGVFYDADGFIIEYNTDNNGNDMSFFSNADLRMKINQSGDVSIDGTYSDGGADYAEFFESTDGKKIPAGTTVTLIGDKVAPAKSSDDVFGVISVNPSFIGNNGAEDAGSSWGGKYVKDEFGATIYEDAEWWSATITECTEKSDGRIRERKAKITGWSDRDKIPNGAHDISKKISKRKKLNPDWVPGTSYVPRMMRDEWNIVGLIGRLRIRKGQPVNSNWIKLRDISANVEEWLVR